MPFENRVRLLRKAYGFSQKKFAECFSVDQTAVSNWERGKNSIDFSVAERIADRFTLPVEFVYGKPYTLTRGKERWSEEEKKGYEACPNEEARELYAFRVGQGVMNGHSPAAPEHTPSEEEIKVALFGGAADVTEEMWLEVKRFVEFVKQKKER